MLDAIRPSTLVAVFALTASLTLGVEPPEFTVDPPELSVDPPDVRINSVSGCIETVDATWTGSNYNIRWTQVTSSGEQVASSLLSSNIANDVDPRIAIAPNGDVLVVWWRDLATDAVIYRKRSLDTGVWGVERSAGAPHEGNSHPRIVFAGDQPWIAYQIQNLKTRSIGAQIIDDDPEPFRSIVATTGFSGDLDIQINAEQRHLWISWIEGSAVVGYSEYNYEKQLWTAPVFENASDSIAAARTRIRESVLRH